MAVTAYVENTPEYISLIMHVHVLLRFFTKLFAVAINEIVEVLSALDAIRPNEVTFLEISTYFRSVKLLKRGKVNTQKATYIQLHVQAIVDCYLVVININRGSNAQLSSGSAVEKRPVPIGSATFEQLLALGATFCTSTNLKEVLLF